LIIVIVLGMGAVTYYYGMEAEAGDSDESGTISRLWTPHLSGSRFL
jgi:hypothetical protein